LARTGFFKPVHVKSLSAHAVRSLIIARKKLVGQRVTLENQIRGLAVVFGVRLPRALTVAFIDNALKASEGIAGLSVAMRGLIAARTAVMTAVAAIDADRNLLGRVRKLEEAIAPRRPAFFGVFDDGLSPVELEAEIERVRKAQGMTENDEALIVRWEPEQ
jgi:transposase